jgi:flagellar biosynthesis protein FlhA
VRIAGAAALALCLIPGLPKLPFLLVGGVFTLMATRMKEKPVVDEDAEAQAAAGPEEPKPDSPEAIAAKMRVDPLELEVAFDLVDLVDTSRGGDLLDRVKALRRKVAMDSGLVIPLVRTRDNLDLPSSQYVIWLNGVPAAKGTSPAGTVLAIGDSLDGLPGKVTREPVFGLAAKWVPVELQRQAELAGATVVDRSSVITTHLAEVVRQNAADLLGREDVKLLVEMVRRTHPVVVEELTPALLTLGEIQRVLHGLLAENVSIRDLVRIFEALSVRAKTSTDIDALVEAARAALGSAISQQYVSPDERLHVMTLDPAFEQRLLEAIRPTDAGQVLALDAGTIDALVSGCAGLLEEAERTGIAPVLVCSPQVRAALARLMRQVLTRLPVISYGEIARTAQIESLGVVNGAVALR